MIRVPKRHPLGIKIPQNWSESFEKTCAKDDVESAQWYGVQVDNEMLFVNRESSLLKESTAGHLITISDRDSEAAVGGKRQSHNGGQFFMDEVMSATRIKQGDQVTIPDAIRATCMVSLVGIPVTARSEILAT